MPETRKVRTPERIYNRVRGEIFYLHPNRQLEILRAIAARTPESSAYVRRILASYGYHEQERVNRILTEICQQMIAQIEAATKKEEVAV